MPLILALIYCFFTGFSLASHAAMDSITTFETGGASNSPGIIDKDHLLIENVSLGYSTKFNGDKSYNYQLGFTKLRYGLIENRLEGRVTNAGFKLDEVNSGFSNMSLGTKIRLSNESKYLPSTEIITDWEIPLGDKNLRNPGFDQSYMLVLGKAWTKKFGSIVNATLDFSSFQTANGTTSAIASLPLVFNVNYYVKPELNLFSHIYSTVYLTEGIDNPLAVDMGASYAINKNLVAVSWVSKGLNDAAVDMSVNAGLIYRL